MNKAEFLSTLKDRLSVLPRDELEERLGFYSEMIDDKIEDGMTEEAAVDEIGSPDKIAAQIIEDTPLSFFIKQKMQSKRPTKGWVLLLIILGFPLWLPLLISAIAVAFSLYASLWAVIISLWAVFISLAAASFGCLLAGVGFIIGGFTFSGLATLSASFSSAGLSIFIFLGCKAATKGTVKLTKAVIFSLKKRFARKEEV